MLGFWLVGYGYVGVEWEILRVAARLGPCCGRRSRGILLPPEDIVSMYFFSGSCSSSRVCYSRSILDYQTSLISDLSFQRLLDVHTVLW